MKTLLKACLAVLAVAGLASCKDKTKSLTNDYEKRHLGPDSLVAVESFEIRQNFKNSGKPLFLLIYDGFGQPIDSFPLPAANGSSAVQILKSGKGVYNKNSHYLILKSATTENNITPPVIAKSDDTPNPKPTRR